MHLYLVVQNIPIITFLEMYYTKRGLLLIQNLRDMLLE